MRRAAIVLALVAAVALAGCAGQVPRWVKKGSGAFPGEQGKAIYGVGIAPYDPNPMLQRDMGRVSARSEVARTEKAYVAELIKNFLQKHEDYFEPKGARSVQFYSQAGKQVTEATLYGSTEIDTWYDRNGAYMEKGTLYVLMVLPLDNRFFTQAQKEYEALLRRYQAELVKKDADEAFKQLDEELKKIREDPLRLTGSVYAEPEEGEEE